MAGLPSEWRGSPVRCKALPLPHEWREWLSLFSAAFGIDKAAAIVRYVRWRMAGSKLSELPPEIPRPPLPPITEGVGTELKKIFTELGISPTSACQCDAKAREWNANGVEWCQSHRAEIIAHLQSAYTHSTLATKAQALGAALWHGYPLSLEGLLGLAIERSRLAQTAGDKP
jgi:hypothetical protein